jgi:uncharacterized protein
MTLQRLVFRLQSGADLRAGIDAACRKHRVRSAAIVTCVGSLQCARLRFADVESLATVEGPLEIVSLVGTVAANGSHLHIAVADAAGGVTGGHLAFGSIVFTTAEIVVLEDSDTAFARVHDAATGYRELEVRRHAPMRRRKISQ